MSPVSDDLTPEMAAYRDAVVASVLGMELTREFDVTSDDAEMIADAVLAVPHPEVERLRAESAIWLARAEARVAELSALRAGIAKAATALDAMPYRGGSGGAILRALLGSDA